MQVTKQITHNSVNMLPGFKHHCVHRIFAQSQYSGGSTHSVTLGNTTCYLPYRSIIVVTVEENSIVRFRKTGPANLTPEQLLPLTLLDTGAGLNQIALAAKSVTLTVFIRTKI
jgi:hypothetical protein